MTKNPKKYAMNAFEQGQMARYDGQPKRNPYSMFSNSINHDKWNEGYDAGGWDKE